MELDELILKFVWNYKGLRIDTLKKNKVGGLVLPAIKVK